jgi:hypothetical protein
MSKQEEAPIGSEKWMEDNEGWMMRNHPHSAPGHIIERLATKEDMKRRKMLPDTELVDSLDQAEQRYLGGPTGRQ